MINEDLVPADRFVLPIGVYTAASFWKFLGTISLTHVATRDITPIEAVTTIITTGINVTPSLCGVYVMLLFYKMKNAARMQRDANDHELKVLEATNAAKCRAVSTAEVAEADESA